MKNKLENKNLFFRLCGWHQWEKKNPFLAFYSLRSVYYIFLWFWFSFLAELLVVFWCEIEKKKTLSFFLALCWHCPWCCWTKRSEGSYKDVERIFFLRFLLSNQCVAWYMSNIIAFKNIIFSLKLKWMSVKQTSYVFSSELEISCEIALRWKAKIKNKSWASVFHSSKLLLLHPQSPSFSTCHDVYSENHRL